MGAETIYKITVSSKEVETISTLINMLDDCPIDLTNDDYIEIIRGIANEDQDIDVKGIQLSFVEGCD